MWKGWSPSRKLAAVVLLVAVVVAGAAFASSSGHSGSSAASSQTSSTTSSSKPNGAAPGGTGSGGAGSTATSTTLAPPLPVEPTVGHTTGLHSGDDVTIHVTADSGSQIFAVEMRMCRAGAVMGHGEDWLPSVTGECASQPLAPGTDGYKVVKGAPPYGAVDATYRVGTGTDTYKLDDGTTNSVTCDSSHPCVLAVKYQIPNGFGFRTYPLTFS